MAYEDSKTRVKQVLRITELVAEDGILDGYTFTECEIKGPAILVLQNGAMTNSSLGGPSPEALLWEVKPPRTIVVGAVLAKNCTFDRCHFVNVGFAGPPEVMQKFRDDAQH